MRDRLPVLIGIAALGFLILAWTLADSPLPLPDPVRPSHPALHPRGSDPVRLVLDAVDDLRSIRRARRLPMGGGGDREYAEALDRAAAEAAGALHYLEEVVLDRGEDVSLRVDLLKIVAGHRDDLTRRFLSSRVADRFEVPALRVAALYPLANIPGDASFETIRRVYLEDAAFAGRYHLCVALGKTRDPRAVPLLIGALEETGPRDFRAHAALALGEFAGTPRVAEDLRRRAKSDPSPVVRQNALRALAATPDGDEILREAARSQGNDSATRALAEALLRERGKAP